MKFILLMIPALVVVIACVVAGRYVPTPAIPMSMSTVSFAQFDAAMGSKSRSTDSQKASAFTGFKGQRVEWTGIVSNANSPSLFVRENVSTITHDVCVVIREDEQFKLSSLDKNMLVTFRGTIDSYGGVVTSHKLIDGEIVSYKRVDQVEVYDFLTRTESAVVDAVR